MFGYLPVLIAAALFFSIPLSSQATTITYNGDDRPILFEGIDVLGSTYDVSVTWGSSFNSVYSAGDPLFWGDYEGDAVPARNALSQALVDDGYTAAPGGYVTVPTGLYVTGLGNTIGGQLVRLVFPLTNTSSKMLANPATGYSNVGYTRFTPVPAPSSIWLLGSGLIGLIGFRRKFKKA